jgi:hypothetical protein
MGVRIDEINQGNVRPARVFRALFWIALVVSVAHVVVHSQPTLIKKNREKDFGSSLGKKSDKKSNDKNPSSDDESIRIETNHVLADTLVVDKKGNVIVGLHKEDFVVSEDGIPQNIESFSVGARADVPRSIVLIIDYSGSLRPYISVSIEAAKLLVDKLRPSDRMAIVTDDIKLVSDFSNDKPQLKLKLDAIRKEALGGYLGKSKQFSALFAVLKELFSDEDLQPIVIFQSDGDEYTFLRPMESEWKQLYRDFSLRFNESSISRLDLQSAVESTRATIYSVIPGVRFLGVPESELLTRGYVANKNLLSSTPVSGAFDSDDWARKMASVAAKRSLAQQGAMSDVAKNSGGFTSFLEDPDEAGAIYAKILNVISTRYQIGYYSKDDSVDGKRHSVKVEVKDHPEYTVLGRKTYIRHEH